MNIGSFSFSNGANQTFPNITDSIRTPYSIALSSGAENISLDAENVNVANFVSFDEGTGLPVTNLILPPPPPQFGGFGLLNVQGNISASGNINSTSIQTQQLNIIGSTGVIDINPIGQIGFANTANTSKLLVGRMDSTSTVQEICTHDGDLLLQSHTGLTNTIINDGNTGFVGIGTNNPTEKLTVQGNSFVSGNMRVGNLTGIGDRQVVADANGNLKIGNPVNPQFICGNVWCGNGNGVAQGNFTPGDFVGTLDGNDLVFKTDGEEQMRITSTGHVPLTGHPGNVGIGTADPQKKLHVVTTHTLCVNCTQTHEGIRLEDHLTDPQLNTTTINAWDLQPYGGIGFAIRKPGQSPAVVVYDNGAVDIQPNNPNTGLNVNGRGIFSGNVGIGTNNPTKKLTVVGDVSFDSYNNNVLNSFEILGNDAVPARRGISLDNDPNGSLNFYVHSFQTPSAFNFKDGNTGKTIMTIDGKSKSVGINLEDLPPNVDRTQVLTNYQLAVAGKVIAVEYVAKYSTNWPDYVFKKEYKLKELNDLEQFIKDKEHLPGIPTAKEVEKNGISLGDMAKMQMEKIEELTLYMIEMNKEIQSLKVENEKLKAEIKK